MSDVTLDPAPVPTAWSPGSLSQELDDLVDAALMMQGSALLVAAQPALAAAWEVEDGAQARVLSQAREAQLVARRHADSCLSVIYPRVVSVLSECRAATNLLEGVSDELSGGEPDGIEDVEDAVRESLNGCQVAVEDLGDDVRRAVVKVSGPLGSTLAAVSALVAEVDDDGWLTQTTKDLETVRADIEKDIAGIYAWRTAFGDSLRGVVESLVKLVQSAPEDKKSDTKKDDPKQKDDAKKDEKKTEEEKPEERRTSAEKVPAALLATDTATPGKDKGKEKDESAGLDVKKINFIADQVAGLREQINALHEHYDRLAGLYLDLAEEHDTLAVGRALIDQVQMLVEATTRTAAGAEALGATWSSILGAAPGSMAGIVDHQLEWRRVQRRLTQLERLLTD